MAAHLDGEWGAAFDWPVIAIHSILTPDNKILTFGTDEQGRQTGEFVYNVWDPVSGEHHTLENTTGTDLFCSVTVLIPQTDEIMTFGGDTRGDPTIAEGNNGVPDVNTYDYRDMSLEPSPNGQMAYGRWYPTAVTLADGNIVVLGGRDEAGAGVGMPELYDPDTGWTELEGAFSNQVAFNWWYPRAWLNSDGRIVMFDPIPPGLEGTRPINVRIMDPTGNGSVEGIGTLDRKSTRLNSSHYS